VTAWQQIVKLFAAVRRTAGRTSHSPSIRLFFAGQLKNKSARVLQTTRANVMSCTSASSRG